MKTTSRPFKRLPALEIDLSAKGRSPIPPQMTMAELRTKCREEIARKFGEFLPGILQNYVDLATRAESEETRRKASERIMAEFQEPKLQPSGQMGSVQVQIVNSIPMPEMSRVGGKDNPTIEAAGAKITINQLVPKKVILPELPPEKRRMPTTGSALELPGHKMTRAPEPSEIQTAPIKSVTVSNTPDDANIRRK